MNIVGGSVSSTWLDLQLNHNVGGSRNVATVEEAKKTKLISRPKPKPLSSQLHEPLELWQWSRGYTQFKSQAGDLVCRH